MARPLSQDLRDRIVAAVGSGLSCRAAASRFAVSESCAINLIRRWRQTGSAKPRAMGGHKPFALAGHEGLVRELGAVRSDQTLDELRSQLAAAGIAVGRTSVYRYLEALGPTLKKDAPRRRTGSPGRLRRALY